MRGNYEVSDEAISGDLTRLPRRFAPHNDAAQDYIIKQKSLYSQTI
ncbi:MAG: hypothetical protein AB8U97_05430 [Rickettsia endosymbiont of Haemaphysalis japonica]